MQFLGQRNNRNAGIVAQQGKQLAVDVIHDF